MSSPVVIRRARASDVDDLAAVHHAAVTCAYAGLFPADAAIPTVSQLRDEWAVAVSDDVCLIGLVDGGAVATAIVQPGPSWGELRRVHVIPSCWGRGIGTAMHDAALLEMAGWTEARLWVLEGNTRARRLYEHLGWELEPGAILEWPRLGVLEVRYRRACL